MSKNRHASLILIVLLLVTTIVYFPKVDASPEDLTTYTEVDPNSHISVTSTTLTVTQMSENEDAYVYKNFGAGYWGDFDCDFEAKPVDYGGIDAYAEIFTMSNYVGSYQEIIDYPHVTVRLSYQNAGYWIFKLKSDDGTTADNENSNPLTQGTNYYLTTIRDDTGFYLDIYTDSARTNLFQALSVTDHTSGTSFQYFYVLQSNNLEEETDWYSSVQQNYEFEEPPEHFQNVALSDVTFWKRVSWTADTSQSHRVKFSLNPDLSTPSFSHWDNGTTAPVVHIPSPELKPHTTIYYRAETYDTSTGALLYFDITRNFATTITAGSIMESVQLVKEGYVDPPDVMDFHFYYNPTDGMFYQMRQRQDNKVTMIYSGTNLMNMEYQGVAVTAPSGWQLSKKGAMLVKDGVYMFWIGIQQIDPVLRGTGFWNSSTGFVDMTYQGLAMVAGENSDLTVNCRIGNVWYNTTNNHFYAVVGGSTTTGGAWNTIYLAESTDWDFRGDTDPSPLYEEGDWGSSSWAAAFIYPFKGAWIGGRFIGFADGCGSGSFPYDFDGDLVFGDSPRGIDSSTFWSSVTATDAYIMTNFPTNHPVHSTAAGEDGALWMITSEKEGDMDVDFYGLAGFFTYNEPVDVEKGYVPRYHYSVAPTETEFNNPLGIALYPWDNDATVTINQLSGTEPVYAQWVVSGVSGDTVWVNIDELTTDTVKLYRNEEYIKDVSPVSGSDFLFSTTLVAGPNTFTLESEAGLTIPTVTTQSATGIDWDDGTFHATLHGTITDTGGENCDERGFDWGYSPGSYSYNWTESGSYGTGAFSHYVSGLDGETVYFRAKAHNTEGWGYGNEMSFSEPEPQNNPPNAPTLNNPDADSHWDMWEYVSFTWTFSDPDPGDIQSAYQLQLDDDSDFSSPLVDTGKVSSSGSSCNAYIPNTIGLFYWRVRTWDNHDLDGNYSSGRTIITDRILVYDISSDDSRRDIGTSATLTVHLHYEYDGADITTGSFTLMGLALTHQSGGDWTTTHSRSTPQSVTFNSVSGSTGNIDDVNMNGKTTTVIWDLIHATATQISDPRVSVNANVDIYFTLKYDYDETAVTDGTVTIEGENATHQGSGVWRITVSKSTTQSVTYDEFTASGGVYGITEVDAEGHSETAIWDRWKLTSFWASSYSPQTGTNVTLFAKGELEYDGHLPNGDDNLEIESIQFEWDWSQGWYEATVSKDTPGAMTYDDLTDVYENTHGIDVGTMSGLSVTVEWGNYTYHYDFYGLYNENGSRAGSVDLSVHLPSGTVIYPLDGNLTEGFNEQPELFSWGLAGGGTRFIFPYKVNESSYIFTPDATYAVYSFTIKDYTGKIGSSNAWLESIRSVNGTERMVERQLIWDTYNPVPLTLAQSQIYILQIRFADGSIHRFGYFVPGAEGTPTLYLYDIDFSDQAHIVTEHVIVEATRPTDTHIRVNYKDELDDTEEVFVEVCLLNETQVWNDTGVGDILQFNWHGADNETDYMVNVEITHGFYGELTYTCWLAGAQADPEDPFDLTLFGDWPIEGAFAVFLIIGTACLFSRGSAIIGMGATVLVAAALAGIGWVDIKYTVLATCFALVVMWGLSGGGK